MSVNLLQWIGEQNETENSNADLLVGRIPSSYTRSERCDLYYAMYPAMIWDWVEYGMDLGRHWVVG